MDMIDALVASAIIMMVWGFIKRFRAALKHSKNERAMAAEDFNPPLILKIEALNGKDENVLYVVMTVTNKVLIAAGTMRDVHSFLHEAHKHNHVFFSTEDANLVALFLPNLPKDIK